MKRGTPSSGLETVAENVASRNQLSTHALAPGAVDDASACLEPNLRPFAVHHLMSGALVELLTRNEREETVAICRSKAQHCREIAKRIAHADQRENMEETARMWDGLADSVEARTDDAAESLAV